MHDFVGAQSIYTRAILANDFFLFFWGWTWGAVPPKGGIGRLKVNFFLVHVIFLVDCVIVFTLMNAQVPSTAGRKNNLLNNLLNKNNLLR